MVLWRIQKLGRDLHVIRGGDFPGFICLARRSAQVYILLTTYGVEEARNETSRKAKNLSAVKPLVSLLKDRSQYLRRA